MRKILMSKPGEFDVETRVDFLRGAAMKMLAGIIREPAGNNESVLIKYSLRPWRRVTQQPSVLCGKKFSELRGPASNVSVGA